MKYFYTVESDSNVRSMENQLESHSTSTRSRPAQSLRRLGAVISIAAVVGAGEAAAANLLEQIGRYETGKYLQSSVEMIATTKAADNVFVLDASELSVKRLSLSLAVDGRAEFRKATLGALPRDLGEPTALAASEEALAVAFAANENNQTVWIASHDGREISRTAISGDYIPSLRFSPDGAHLVGVVQGDLVVSGDGIDTTNVQRNDPEGSIFVISELGRGAGPRIATFTEDALATKRPFRLAGSATVAEAAEPDGIFFGADPGTAWITLSKNNAVARFDIANGKVAALLPLGAKDFAAPGSGADLIADGKSAIVNAPFRGMFMPQALAVVEQSTADEPLLITANGGYDRDQTAPRLKAAKLDAKLVKKLTASDYGRVLISKLDGDEDADGDIDAPHLYGARSVSVWRANGAQLFDSGDELERNLSAQLGPNFNGSVFGSAKTDVSSESFGPQPAAIVTAELPNGKPIAIVAMKVTGSLAVYDIAAPQQPRLIGITQLRDHSVSDQELLTNDGLSKAGAIGPVHLHVVDAPQGEGSSKLLLVVSQISGTIDALRIGE